MVRGWAALTAVSALLVSGCGAGPDELLGGGAVSRIGNSSMLYLDIGSV